MPLQKRRDLVAQPLSLGSRRAWAIKDPWSLRYYQLQEEEYALWEMLDGQVSLEQLKARFDRQFAPYRVSTRQVQAFVSTLHQQGLVVSDAPGQGAELLRRRQRSRWQSVGAACSNVLAIRFRGFDPQRLLRWLEPRTRWLFSKWFLATCLTLVSAALFICATQWAVLRQRLPEFHAFFTASNIAWLVVAVAGCKILHELGHMLTCRHFGGQCHEMGIMLLVFTPCLYCNVSDAWMLPSRWQRAAIGAAGVAVELVLAAACTLLWWFSEPGLFNTMCLNVMLACSVSTLFFNGNPLLRYDGYYVLSDLVGVPNLGQRASEVVRRGAQHWFVGIDSDDGRPFSTQGRWLLAAYSIASGVYRCLLVVAIAWFFHKLLKPHHLEVLASVLGGAVLIGMVAAPLSRAVRSVNALHWSRRMNWKRAIVRGGAVLLVGAGLASFPLPYRVQTPVVLEPQGAQRVYVTSPGTLRSAVAAGEQVTAGQVLATLENLEVALEIAKLQGTRDRQRLHLANLRTQQSNDPRAAAELPAAQEALAGLEERLAQLTRDQERLTLVAIRSGMVLPPPEQIAPTEPGALSNWVGTPLDPENQGSYLETGTLLCLVGQPDELEAVLVVDQDSIALVELGQRVELALDQAPTTTLWGAVTEIAELDLQLAPRELIARAELPVKNEGSGARPLNTSYQVRVALDEHSQRVLGGAAGKAKIHVAPQSLAWRLGRFLSSTFRFER